MKLKFVIASSFLILSAFVHASSNYNAKDYEIFSLNDKIKNDLGEDMTFYSWLGLSKGPKSTAQEINKAYRKASIKLHPDKFSGKSSKVKKQAEERFQRLSSVGNILKDKSLKKRYDYYYHKGFPKWKKDGYFYSKFRPSIILTLIFLYLLVSTFHFFALKINRKQDFKRLQTLKNDIKLSAWGGSAIPPADGSDRKVINESSDKEFIVKPDGSIFLVSSKENGKSELILLNENEIALEPRLKETLYFRIPVGLWNFIIGRLFSSLKIDLQIPSVVPKSNWNTDVKKKQKTDSQKKGKKIELPNGKVIYTRRKNT